MTEARASHLQKVQEINTALTHRRNSFIERYKAGHMGSRALTYEPALDREIYQTLKTFENGDANAYEHAKNNLNGYTMLQVETFIGERLNVGLSSFHYDLRDGQIYGVGMDEPLLQMIARGRDCRDHVVNDVDKPRQQAEIEQFTKIQDIMGSPNATPGATIISLSPPGGEGSAYSSNFYDVFVLEEDTQTKDRSIAAHRYASELSIDEYQTVAEKIIPGYLTEHAGESMDSYFLSHPLVVPDKSELSGNPEKIHEYLHKGHDFLSTEDFNVVRRQIAGLIISYVNTLCDMPDDKEFLELTLNAVMNKADKVVEHLRHPVKRQEMMKTTREQPVVPVRRSDIQRLGKLPVREATTGCGLSGGFGQDRTASNMSQSSVVDYGRDSLGARTFNCPECGEMNIRPVNEKIPNCQHCGSEKVAC